MTQLLLLSCAMDNSMVVLNLMLWIFTLHAMMACFR